MPIEDLRDASRPVAAKARQIWTRELIPLDIELRKTEYILALPLADERVPGWQPEIEKMVQDFEAARGNGKGSVCAAEPSAVCLPPSSGGHPWGPRAPRS